MAASTAISRRSGSLLALPRLSVRPPGDDPRCETRAYAVAVTVVWAESACTVLAVLTLTVKGTWLHVGMAAGAVLELLFAGLTLRFLSRASVGGRFDV